MCAEHYCIVRGNLKRRSKRRSIPKWPFWVSPSHSPNFINFVDRTLPPMSLTKDDNLLEDDMYDYCQPTPITHVNMERQLHKMEILFLLSMGKFKLDLFSQN